MLNRSLWPLFHGSINLQEHVMYEHYASDYESVGLV